MKRAIPVIALALAGCFPHNFELVPEIGGRVVNEKNEGVEGLWVGVIESRSLPDERKVFALTTTDKEGRFFLPKATQWGVYFVPQEPYLPHRFSLELKKGGATVYSSPLVDYKKGIAEATWQNVEIKLSEGK